MLELVGVLMECPQLLCGKVLFVYPFSFLARTADNDV